MSDEEAPPPPPRKFKKTGSLEPIEGRCGRRLPGLDEQGNKRYCKKYPLAGKTACARCGGKTPIGPANPRFKTGKHSKWVGILPQSIAKHFDLSRPEEIISCHEQIALLDARVMSLLEGINLQEPIGGVGSSRVHVGLLELALHDGDMEAANAAIEKLKAAIEKQSAEARAWAEIRDTLRQRSDLTRTEIQNQKMISEMIRLDQMENFMRALVMEAKVLTKDPVALSAYVVRVLEMARGVAGRALLPDNVHEGEIVEEETNRGED